MAHSIEHYSAISIMTPAAITQAIPTMASICKNLVEHEAVHVLFEHKADHKLFERSIWGNYED